MDMDIDDLSSGDHSSQGAPRPSRFLPKSSKLKPKLESVSSQLDDALIQQKVSNEEDSKMLVDPIMGNTVVTETKIDQVMKAEKEEEEQFKKKDETMEEANAEDQLVREIDVFFQPSPLDSDTQLYVVQQPLRPSWRPYDFQKCLEVSIILISCLIYIWCFISI